MPFLERTEMLLGAESSRTLGASSVALFGLGGVGGGALEALARAGIGEFHLIDADSFVESNLNRQLLATRNTLGMKKVDAAKDRVLSINPDAKIYTYPIFFGPDSEGIDFSRFDFVIDAIDSVSGKLEIIKRCSAAGIPMVSCMGCGNRLDPSKLHITDLFKTEYDPLAKVIRKKCREFGIKHLRVVASSEMALRPVNEEGESSRTPGSTPFVPPAAGFLLAQEAVSVLLGR